MNREQLRQLGDVGGDAPRLVAGEQLGRRAPSRLLLEINVGERLPVGVADDEAGVGLLDGPGRREVRCSGAFLCLCECIASRSGRAAMGAALTEAQAATALATEMCPSPSPR